MDEHKRCFPLQEINIPTPHGLLTWKLEVNLNGICWKLKKKKMYNIVLSIIHVHVMGKTDRKKNLQSQTKITVGILPLNTVFFHLSYLLSLPMLLIAVHSPNLVHQQWEGQKTVKCPNNFGLKTTGKISIKYNSQNMTWVPLNFFYYRFSTSQNSLSFAVVLQGNHL